jgi:hypothetical protein
MDPEKEIHWNSRSFNNRVQSMSASADIKPLNEIWTSSNWDSSLLTWASHKPKEEQVIIGYHPNNYLFHVDQPAPKVQLWHAF